MSSASTMLLQTVPSLHICWLHSRVSQDIEQVRGTTRCANSDKGEKQSSTNHSHINTYLKINFKNFTAKMRQRRLFLYCSCMSMAHFCKSFVVFFWFLVLKITVLISRLQQKITKIQQSGLASQSSVLFCQYPAVLPACLPCNKFLGNVIRRHIAPMICWRHSTPF